jgi:translocation and assembly module TamA
MLTGIHTIRITALPLGALVVLLWMAGMQGARADVVMDGLDAGLRDNVLAYLRLDDEACDAPRWRVRRLFVESETEIREALEVVGYYSVVIDKKLEQGESCWQANYTITTGQPVTLRQVSINIDTGDATDEKLQAVAKKCDLDAGQVLQHAAYDTCRRQITRVAERRGYFSAEFTDRRIDVFPERFVADITLHMVTGPRYVFGKPTIDQAVLDADLIRRFVDIVPGEPYDAERVRRLQRDLIGSTYFDQVSFTPTPRGAPYFDVPIHVN